MPSAPESLARGSSNGFTVLGVDNPIHDPKMKRELARRHDAEVVDCESHVFAHRLEQAGIPWLIVRGISDGPDDPLPREVDQWVDGAGRTRLTRVLRSVLARPTMVPTILGLARRSSRALDAAVAQLDEILERRAGA